MRGFYQEGLRSKLLLFSAFISLGTFCFVFHIFIPIYNCFVTLFNFSCLMKKHCLWLWISYRFSFQLWIAYDCKSSFILWFWISFPLSQHIIKFFFVCCCYIFCFIFFMLVTWNFIFHEPMLSANFLNGFNKEASRTVLFFLNGFYFFNNWKYLKKIQNI